MDKITGFSLIFPQNALSEGKKRARCDKKTGNTPKPLNFKKIKYFFKIYTLLIYMDLFSKSEKISSF
jgi:hypothetical protein